ncbi:MAG: cytochrome C oxidase subunit IV family protein [Enhygromyxa sp.]
MAHSEDSHGNVYLNGKLVENPHEDHHHVSPLWVFTAVFIALLCLTVLTYLVSFAGLGAASLPVAMFVASIKALLVIGYFMHLKYEDRFYSFVFMVSFLFIGIFFTFTLFDMNTTGDLNQESDIRFKRQVEDASEAAENAAALKAAGAASAPAPAGGGQH